MQGKVRAVDRALARWMVSALIVVSLAACKEQLHGRVTERDANEILATLYAAGVHAGKSPVDEETWSVEVAAADLQRSLQILREHGLPREQFSSTGELFKKEGLVSTPSEERIRFIFALSQELAHTLSQIDGVVSARVHPVIPANDPLSSQVRPASASVFIKHRRDADLQAMAPAIKNLVMRGIEGLAYENISLTFVAAEEPVRNNAAPALATSGSIDVANIVIGLLATLLLFALSAAGFLWGKYRALSARGTAQSEGATGAATASKPDHRAIWSAFRLWRKPRGGGAQQQAPQGRSDGSFATDTAAPREAT
ncbi:MAG: type III secretion system inner membrane ring lipoprotein SctJ [Steroidobacteraceae bacterium]